jgi:carbamoyl-phosphate synthase large subunit
MKSLKLLVSAVGGDIGAGVVKSLRDYADRIIGIDCRAVYDPEKIIDEFYKIRASSEGNAYLDDVLEIIKQSEIDFFIPVSEAEIMAVNKNRSKFSKCRAGIVINNSFIIETFLDKFKTFEFLKDAGLPVPETFLLSNYQGQLKSPLVVKSRFGSGSKKVWLIEDEVDLRYLKEKDRGDLIAQEYLGSPEDEFTTGVFSDGSQVASITFKRSLGFGGLSIEAELYDAPFMENISRKIASLSNLVGSLNIQTRKVGENFIPFEINPRFSSTLVFRKKFGFDDAVWWINALNGKTFQYRRKYRRGRALRRLKEYYLEMD